MQQKYCFYENTPAFKIKNKFSSEKYNSIGLKNTTNGIPQTRIHIQLFSFGRQLFTKKRHPKYYGMPFSVFFACLI